MAWDFRLGFLFIFSATNSIAAPATHLQINAGGTQFFDVPFPIQVQALDAAGNPATNYTGTVTFTGAPNAQLPAPYTFTPADGSVHQFSITFHSYGWFGATPSLTATDNTGLSVTWVVGALVFSEGPGISPPPAPAPAPPPPVPAPMFSNLATLLLTFFISIMSVRKLRRAKLRMASSLAEG